MQKIGLIIIAVCFLGFANADLPPNCLKTNLFLDVNRCCFQRGNTVYDAAIAECFQKYADTPNPKYCGVNCAVEATGLGNLNTGVNYTNLLKFFNEYVNNNVLTGFMTQTVKRCVNQVNKMLQNPEYNTVNSTCDPTFALIHECTSLHAILNCPAKKWRTGDSDCEQIRTDIRSSCPFNY